MNAFLDEPNLRICEMLDMAAVRRLVGTQGQSFGRPWFGQLMAGPQLIAYLLQLEMWLREYRIRICI
jgi:asparagine synthase (glutamine-hydrolysing)